MKTDFLLTLSLNLKWRLRWTRKSPISAWNIINGSFSSQRNCGAAWLGKWSKKSWCKASWRRLSKRMTKGTRSKRYLLTLVILPISTCFIPHFREISFTQSSHKFIWTVLPDFCRIRSSYTNTISSISSIFSRLWLHLVYLGIDLFSLYVLFSHFRPRDAIRVNSSVSHVVLCTCKCTRN